MRDDPDFDIDTLNLSPDDLRELYGLVPALYPAHLTPPQAVARYCSWIDKGLSDLARFLSGCPTRLTRPTDR